MDRIFHENNCTNIHICTIILHARLGQSYRYFRLLCQQKKKKREMPYRNHQAHNKNVIGKNLINKRLKKVLNKCKSTSEKRRGLDLEFSILNT